MTVKYSIHEMEKLSGIKAHTIRIWEKRYHLLSPSRTDTNIRYYSNEDLRKLLNVSSLVNHGLKISSIGKLSASEMNGKVEEIIQLHKKNDEYLPVVTNTLLSALMEYDEEQFNKAFSLAVLKLGFTDTIAKIIYPVLEKIGLLWSTTKIIPAQEHFISNLLRQKISSATDSLMLKPDKKETYLLFLPEGELHEIGLLMANYLLRAAGKHTIYLGQNVPFENVVETYNTIKPAHLMLFSITPTGQEAFSVYLKKLARECESTHILLCGNAGLIDDKKLPASVKKLTQMEQLQSWIKTN